MLFRKAQVLCEAVLPPLGAFLCGRLTSVSAGCFGLVWLGLVWLEVAWFGLAWLGLVWLGLACLGLSWLRSVGLGFVFGWIGLALLGAWLGLAWLGLASFGLTWLSCWFGTFHSISLWGTPTFGSDVQWTVGGQRGCRLASFR